MDFRLLAVVLPAQAATIVGYIVLWRFVIFKIDPARPKWVDSAGAFCCSWLARHAPTGVPYVAGKVVLAGRLGHKRPSIIASILYENVVVVCVFTASSAAVLLLTDTGLPRIAWCAVIAIALGMLTLTALNLPGRVIRHVAPRATRLDAMIANQVGIAGMFRSAAICLGAGAFNGLAFVALLSAMADPSWQEMLVAGAAFNLSGAAGIAAVPVPSGVGVRELVLVALLHSIVPLEVATVAAVTVRATGIMIDLLFAGIGLLIYATRARRNGQLRLSSYSPSPL
jgi:hypothetical protein